MDSTGASTWFLDSCALTPRARQRLLLTSFDLGFDVSGQALQPGLNFSKHANELFASTEIQNHIKTEIALELPLIRAAARLAQQD